VGVREIAKEAKVNIAMISYYYDGKTGILQAIMEEFFNRYLEILRVESALDKSPEECLREIVSRIIRFIRENTDLAMAAYNEFPLDVPSITEFKAQRISQLISKIGWLMQRFGLHPGERVRIGIIGPGLLSMIIMNFRIRPLLSRVFQARFDEEYYKKFEDTVTTLFLDGVHGVANLNTF
jgi:AcrR family transcriptional regulator